MYLMNFKNNHVLIRWFRMRLGDVRMEACISSMVMELLTMLQVWLVVWDDNWVFIGEHIYTKQLQCFHFCYIIACALYANAYFFLSLFTENDSYEAIMMINLGETIWVVVDNIVDDVKDLLMYFSLKEVQYPPRDCNTMTHVSTYFALHEQSRNY